MRVKTTAIILLSLCLAACAARVGGPSVTWSVELSPARAGPSCSLCVAGGVLYAVYTDWDSAALRMDEVPAAAEAPEPPRTPSLVDKVDVAPPLTGGLGENTAASGQSAPFILYKDRQKEDRLVLKVVTRAPAGRWAVETLEPAGEPVALIQGEDGAPRAVWSAEGALRARSLPRGDTAVLFAPFSAAAAGSPAGRGFTAYDTRSQALFWFSPGPGGLVPIRVPGAGPVHSAALTADGGIAVATYAADRKRILLLEPRGRKWRAATVTVSDSTRIIGLVQAPGGYVFLYDGREGMRGGGQVFTLSLLFPRRGGYQRWIAWEGRAPVEGAALAEKDGALYLLTAADGVTLRRIVLPPR